ncbi:MAG: PIG-L deacetylase family protein [Pseudonocardiaceae bacterium]
MSVPGNRLDFAMAGPDHRSMDAGLSLMVVVAHPDDDAYGMAGTVALHADDPGFRYVLLHATDGAAGDIRPDFPATRESLGAVRRAEDERAWRALGRRPDRHVWLGYDDGGLTEVPFGELVDRIAVLLGAERPDVVGTFGPDGITGHPDHIRVGAATDEAFDLVAAQPGEGLHRLVHGALPQSVFERWNETRRLKGMTPWDPNVVYHLRGVPDEQIGITVDTSSVAHRVVAGLREHRSQRHVIATPDVTDEQWARSTSAEHYVVARPRRHAGAPVLADVFDGLPAAQDGSARHGLGAI